MSKPPILFFEKYFEKVLMAQPQNLSKNLSPEILRKSFEENNQRKYAYTGLYECAISSQSLTLPDSKSDFEYYFANIENLEARDRFPRLAILNGRRKPLYDIDNVIWIGSKVKVMTSNKPLYDYLSLGKSLWSIYEKMNSTKLFQDNVNRETLTTYFQNEKMVKSVFKRDNGYEKYKHIFPEPPLTGNTVEYGDFSRDNLRTVEFEGLKLEQIEFPKIYKRIIDKAGFNKTIDTNVEEYNEERNRIKDEANDNRFFQEDIKKANQDFDRELGPNFHEDEF